MPPSASSSASRSASSRASAFQIADMITEIDAADWLTLAVGLAAGPGGLPANREIASAKLYATEMLARVTDQTLQIFGGMGLMDDFPIERFWRDARVERIWDGTSEIQRHIISRDLFGRWARESPGVLEPPRDFWPEKRKRLLDLARSAVIGQKYRPEVRDQSDCRKIAF